MTKIYGKYNFNKTNFVEIADVFDEEDAKRVTKDCAKVRSAIKYLEDYVIDKVIDALTTKAALAQYNDDRPECVMFAMETKHGRTTFFIKLDTQDSENSTRFVFEDLSVYQDGMLILHVPEFYTEAFLVLTEGN